MFSILQQSVFAFVCLCTPASVQIGAVFAAVCIVHTSQQMGCYITAAACSVWLPVNRGGGGTGSGTNGGGGFRMKEGNERRWDGGSDAPLATCYRSRHGTVNLLSCVPLLFYLFFSLRCAPPHIIGSAWFVFHWRGSQQSTDSHFCSVSHSSPHTGGLPAPPTCNISAVWQACSDSWACPAAPPGFREMWVGGGGMKTIQCLLHFNALSESKITDTNDIAE